MAMSNAAKWALGIVAGVFVFGAALLFLFAIMIFWTPEDETLSTSGKKVAIVELNDVILSSKEIVRQFKKYRENSSVRAIVFRIESPGGGVSASQEIYEEVKKTRESGKPVVVSMGSVAASGGYYVACGASRIMANPGTITGSIGVIFQYLHINELLKKIGVDAATYKTGKYKDAGSPFRNPTEDDRVLYSQLLADVYDQFVEVVATERKLKRATVIKYADGRVFTGRQAHEYGFVDTLGTFQDAIGLAAKLGDIEGKPRVIQETQKRRLWDFLIGDAVSELTRLRSELLEQPIVQYKFIAP
ncbi:MAG: signal peptide peptidase SppA [Ignavibacteria bacterium]|nr:signal peptide peptidase SppA [Ignavibacteria bacterium]